MFAHDKDSQESLRQAVRATLERRFGEDGLAYWRTFLEPLRRAAWHELLAHVAQCRGLDDASTDAAG